MYFFFFFSSDYNNIGKFLNRILGMEVHQQNALFQYFSDTLNAVIQNAKKNGRYDMGILGELLNISLFLCLGKERRSNSVLSSLRFGLWG